ncbi:YcjF family protein [Argonema galeatum]|uniref:YcjF family protein n=1 Tax=Argonema galeatum TaxID=2942762 RepID=UPI002012F92B|nr:GTP-binding protein [Argonema galeatum]MCL1464715.1 GTP-binding protein [Argonema galeatum A003/A1]
MRLSRLLPLVASFTVLLGLVIWLISSLTRLYSNIAWSAPPLLANLLLFLLIVLLAMLIAAFGYYAMMFWEGQNKPRRRKIQPKVPEAKTEAAAETLRAVRKQVKQIQDEVSRQALLTRSREIEATLSRGNLQVVVFGTGSAGKTSLVNALMGRMVGQVNAPMGTTEVGETYNLKLKGLEREILITDTPGILEAGVAGTEREQLARQLATEADLLLFVVDNDLRRSEYEPLRALAEIGKRSLLVLNKTDLYTDEDKESIQARLRERIRGFIATSDIVAIAANPKTVKLENGDIFQAEPDVMPLIRRLAIVLRAEGDDLMADNILLQSQRLGEEARKLIDAQRRRQADKVVERFQWIGAGVIAVTPLPVVDLLATAAVNAQMVVEIGKIYGCELNMERGRELALSLGKTLASLGIVKGAIELLSRALQLNLATYLVGKAIQGVTAAYITRIAGKSFIEYFRHDQDWGDGGITEVVQRQFQLNRKDEFVKAFVQEAIAKVVKPLTDNFPPERESDEEVEEQYEEEELEKEDRKLEPKYAYDDWTDTSPKRDDW